LEWLKGGEKVIKIKSYERDALNPSNVLVTIEYDIDGVIQPTFVIDAPMVTVVNSTLVQLKSYIIDKVEEQRGTQLWGDTQTKLDPWIDVDLEA
jgi:hypothetical protein